MKVRLHSGKLQHVFQTNPLYLSSFTQGKALCSLEDSAPISEDSDPRMPGVSPTFNHRRRATNTTLTQMFYFSPQRQCIFQVCLYGWVYRLHSPKPINLLGGTLSLAKVHLLFTLPVFHASPAHISPPQHQWAAAEVTQHTTQWAQSPCFLAASTG